MDLHDMAEEAAKKQAEAEKEAFEKALCPVNQSLTTEILLRAAKTIDRLGKAAQDCRSCAKLPMCNAYQSEENFEGCDYEWSQAEAVRRLTDETSDRP